jgi:hypothetical protein
MDLKKISFVNGTNEDPMSLIAFLACIGAGNFILGE